MVCDEVVRKLAIEIGNHSKKLCAGRNEDYRCKKNRTTQAYACLPSWMEAWEAYNPFKVHANLEQTFSNCFRSRVKSLKAKRQGQDSKRDV